MVIDPVRVAAWLVAVGRFFQLLLMPVMLLGCCCAG